MPEHTRREGPRADESVVLAEAQLEKVSGGPTAVERLDIDAIAEVTAILQKVRPTD